MESHGKDQTKNNVIAVIPARYGSVRLPGKMLEKIGGKPLIVHTAERARSASLVDDVIVATDDIRIYDVVTEAGFEAKMTSPDHNSGTDRIAEVACSLPEGTIVVNVQGDEPLISPDTIDRAVGQMHNSDADIVTAYESIISYDDELLNFNVVKVVTNEDDRALYFSRSPMPFPRDASNRYGGPREAFEVEPELFSILKKHVGLYVYRREYLLKFTQMPQTRLEKIEMLEQLRALENGADIRVVEAVSKSIGVDSQADLVKVQEVIKGISG